MSSALDHQVFVETTTSVNLLENIYTSLDWEYEPPVSTGSPPESFDTRHPLDQFRSVWVNKGITDTNETNSLPSQFRLINTVSSMSDILDLIDREI